MAAARKTTKKKKPATGKSAVSTRVAHEIVVKCQNRYYDAYDARNGNARAFGNTKLIIEVVDGDVYVRDEECETQFKIKKATFAALVEEINKKVEVKS